MVSVPWVTLMPPPNAGVAGAAATLDRGAAVVEQHAVRLVEDVRRGRRRVLGGDPPQVIPEVEIEARQHADLGLARGVHVKVRVEPGHVVRVQPEIEDARAVRVDGDAPMPTPVAVTSSVASVKVAWP